MDKPSTSSVGAKSPAAVRRTVALGDTAPSVVCTCAAAAKLADVQRVLAETQRILADVRQQGCEQRANFNTLKAEHVNLQKDFVALQQELRTVLAETKEVKARSAADVQSLQTQLDDRVAVIDTLRAELQERDPQLLREKFAAELNEPIKRLEREKERLERDKERLCYELNMAKQQIERDETVC